LEIIKLGLDELKPYEKNAKRHPEKQIEQIKKSIEQFGNNDPIAVWGDDNTIVEGHGRYIALKELGYTEAECIRLDHLTDEERKAYTLAHNKLTMNSDFDFDLLDSELDDIFDIDMSDFGFDLDFDDEPAEIVEDETPEPPEEPKAKLGDLWQLGNHRLICGDSTDSAVIDRLMDGVKADMVFTDPPYNIASDSKNFASDVSKAMKDLSESEWDKNFDIREVLDNILVSIAENATVYVCTSHFLASNIWAWMKEWADHYSYCVWSKPNPMPSLAKRHWTWNTELICYATRGKHTFNFPKEGHALSTWTINKRNGDTGHPTEKPVEVPATAVSHSSKEKDVVLDLFGGSGSTLIACEQLNRKCYMCELSPNYVDVIIQRYINFKGSDEDVFLIRDGEEIPYNEL
jgi:site-specific DNA-methyltransferase (adenine-specific)